MECYHKYLCEKNTTKLVAAPPRGQGRHPQGRPTAPQTMLHTHVKVLLTQLLRRIRGKLQQPRVTDTMSHDKAQARQARGPSNARRRRRGSTAARVALQWHVLCAGKICCDKKLLLARVLHCARTSCATLCQPTRRATSTATQRTTKKPLKRQPSKRPQSLPLPPRHMIGGIKERIEASIGGKAVRVCLSTGRKLPE